MGNDGYFLTSLAPIIVRGHILSGDYFKALELAHRCTPNDAYNRCKVDLLKAQAFLACGKTTETKASFESAMATENKDIEVVRLVELLPELISQNILSADKPLIARLLAIAENAQSRGRARESFDAAYLCYEYAISLGLSDTAISARNVMSSVVTSLHNAKDAEKQLAEAMSYSV